MAKAAGLNHCAIDGCAGIGTTPLTGFARLPAIWQRRTETRRVTGGWMTRFLSELRQDIRYGARTMTANKAFSALAVLSLSAWHRRQHYDLQLYGVDPAALAAGGRSRVAGGLELA